jgi:hypothetical protein
LLYKHRKCPICNNENETFYHVCCCSKQHDNIVMLKQQYFEILLEQISKDEFISNINSIHKISDIYWSIDLIDNHFTFLYHCQIILII